MYRLDNLIEQWAADFKLVSHNPEGGAAGKRFFRIDSISDLKPVILSLTKIKTPVVAFSTQIEGSSNESGAGTYYLANIFILVQQEQTTSPYREDLNGGGDSGKAEGMAHGEEEERKALPRTERSEPEICGYGIIPQTF